MDHRHGDPKSLMSSVTKGPQSSFSPATRLGLAIVGSAIGILIVYLITAGFIGYFNSLRPVCPKGYRALSVDGSKSIVPDLNGNLVQTDSDYPVCSPMLACPTNGAKYAVLKDGSALGNACDESNCKCTIFQHCPAYVSTLFRQFGADDRISLFQVVDPMVNTDVKIPDPYNPPNILYPANNDSCFLTASTRPSVWPALALGAPCLRGTLAQLSTNPSMMACVPGGPFITSTPPNGIPVFDVDAYMRAYIS